MIACFVIDLYCVILKATDSEIIRTFHQKKKKATSKEKVGQNIENIIEDKMAQEPREKPSKNYFGPFSNLSTSCIQYRGVAARSFEIKPNAP